MISRTYLDVDGVINSLNPLWGRYWPVPRSELSVHRCNGFDIHLPDHMAALIGALDAQTEIVWCTTWEDSANHWIGPLVGLEERRVIHPDPADETGDSPLRSLAGDDYIRSKCGVEVGELIQSCAGQQRRAMRRLQKVAPKVALRTDVMI